MFFQHGVEKRVIAYPSLNFKTLFVFSCACGYACIMTYVIHQAPVVQKLDSAIHRINLYPVDNAIGFPNTYPLDSDLSGG